MDANFSPKKSMSMKPIKILLLIFTTSFTTQSNAGIPVIDTSSLTQHIMSVSYSVDQIAKLVEQVNTAKEQLTTAADTFTSMQGLRNMGAGIHSAYDPSMEVTVHAILNKNGMTDSAGLGIGGAAGALYDEANNLSATYLGKTNKSLQQSQDRFTEILKLVGKINSAPEQKDILDLQARISAESSLLQNELIKISALRAQNEANEAIMKRKREQMHLQFSGTSNDISL